MGTIIYLNNLSMLITRYVGTSFYTFGCIGALLNLYVFSQSSLLSNPCCSFLLALNIVDILHIHNSLFIRVAQHGFQWDPIVIFPLLCRIRYYIAYTLITLDLVLITLASFERYASTCDRHSHWRSFSKLATVRNTIVTSTLICSFISLFAFFCYTVHDASLCAVRKGVCSTLTTVYTFVVIGFVPPVLTTMFAWLTVRNLYILRHRSRTGPVSYKTYFRIKQVNDQLTSMLFMQIVAMLVSSLPYALLIAYQVITRSKHKAPLLIAWDQLISQFVHLLTYVNYVCSAYIYLATSTMYRKHLMSRSTQFRKRYGIGIQALTSALLSLSRAEKETAVLPPSVRTETTGQEQQQQQQHHLRVVWVHIVSPEQESSNVDCSTNIALHADRV